jgi:putative NIF3 family GTP cyclohydrolase 1 type 2
MLASQCLKRQRMHSANSSLGGCTPIVGPFARKIQLCMTRNLSLYAAHLPLDGHPEVGNAAQLAKLLGLLETTPGFLHKGAPIGVVGTLPSPKSLQELASRLESYEGALHPPLTLPFGTSTVKRLGIATGSATSLIPECAALGIDTLLTGESKQEAYHMAKEYRVNLICMGHYASETFGVRALERVLQSEFRVETCWISEPTGI